MTNENISVQNDVETIEIATTDIDVKEEIVDSEVTTSVENEQKAQDDDYLLVVNDLKEYFPISKSLIKSNTVYLKAVDGVSLKLKAGHTIGIVGESGCGKRLSAEPFSACTNRRAAKSYSKASTSKNSKATL